MTSQATGSQMTLDEMGESLTGFEEIAIEKHFDHDITHLLEHRPTMGIRALIFTEKVRSGAAPLDGVKAAMSLPLKDVMGWYADDEFEPDPDDPQSESGKDEQPPTGELKTSPAGA